MYEQRSSFTLIFWVYKKIRYPQAKVEIILHWVDASARHCLIREWSRATSKTHKQRNNETTTNDADVRIATLVTNVSAFR